MIIDNIGNASAYYDLGLRIEAGLDFLQAHDLTALEPGVYPILDDECFVVIEDYLTRPRSERRWEAHHHHIDIQFIASGREMIGYADLSVMRHIGDYNEAKDLEFLESDAVGEFFEVVSGRFMILYPEDAHMPCIAVSNPEPVRKVVVKVLLEDA